MPKTAPKAEVGTIKVGRWTYNAARFSDGSVTYRKKDGITDLLATEAQAAAFVPAAGRLALVPPAPAEKATKTTKKPAKKVAATPRAKHEWKVGGKCPNGHTLTAESLYAMPSGRHQCRECRAALRAAKKASA